MCTIQHYIFCPLFEFCNSSFFGTCHSTQSFVVGQSWWPAYRL